MCRFMPEYAGLCRFPSEVAQHEHHMRHLVHPNIHRSEFISIQYYISADLLHYLCEI
ncbi:hypothetical protein LX64_02433 [Chitinophaga skermanii]|uniref:Uncharacterized protein n=1 Tax=Chitinophaga skermanii TaxID=331697 RepID=A0A327QML2_9BACT|nr:hypothetical protein LX64_02433 [Chitinophaga skermanii]